MRVAQVCGPFRPDRGGIARVVATLSQGLRERGHEVVIFSALDEPNGEITGAEKVEDPKRVRPELVRRVSAIHPDIIHVHCYSSWLPANVAALRAAGYPIVFTPHFHPWGTHPRWKRKLFDAFVGNAVFRSVSEIHALTQGEADSIVSIFGVPRQRITVVNNPLPPRFRVKGPLARPAGGAHRLVLFVGRIDDQKGLAYLIDAFAQVEKSPGLENVELKIVGDDSDPFSEELRSQIKRLGLARAALSGPVSDSELERLYEEAALLVLPSAYEAFGMVLIEAMARGCPVVASRVGGIPWIVSDGENGLLVPYGSAEALRAALVRVLTDAPLAKRLQEGGFSAVSRYSLPAIAKRIEALYVRAINAA